MQCWDEYLFETYYLTHEKLFELLYNSLKQKFKRQTILKISIHKAILNIICSRDDYFLQKKRLEDASIKNYATKILKLYLDDYVIKRLYRFPDGLRLSELESRFKALQ